MQTHGPGDVRLRMKVSPQARKKDPGLPLTWEVRAITRELDGKPRTLFTSLMDPARYKAEEVFALYHERWEIELAYGEMKTGHAAPGHDAAQPAAQGSSRSCGPPC